MQHNWPYVYTEISIEKLVEELDNPEMLQKMHYLMAKEIQLNKKLFQAENEMQAGALLLLHVVNLLRPFNIESKRRFVKVLEKVFEGYYGLF